MRQIIISIALILSMFRVTLAAEIFEMRVWNAPSSTRVVFDANGPLTHDLFTLENPNRIVVDIANADWDANVPIEANKAQFINLVRVGMPKKGVRRVVFEVDGNVRVESMLLAPTADKGYRLVVDLFPDKVAVAPAPSTVTPTAPSTSSTPAVKGTRQRPIIVAVDAGHGGEDPGAIGKRGTREKDVVLAIAKKVKAEIDKKPNMQAFLTRTGDYYIPLRKRTKMAQDRGADIFVSVHADAARNRSAKGSSVYTLSLNGASSEQARVLAKNENNADTVAGVSLKNRDPVVSSVLVEKALENSMATSKLMAKDVLDGLKVIGPLHSKRVEQAGFVVLKNTEALSMLVETAYISNPNQEKDLKSSSYQQKLASKIADGIEKFVKTSNYRFFDETVSN